MLPLKILDERGSASLEFITTGMLLLIPMVYLVLALSSVQGATLAVEGAARQAARVYATAADDRSGARQAERAVELALADHGLELAAASVTVTCQPRPDQCVSRLGTVTVTVGVRAALPFVPQVLSIDAGVAVPVQASATQQVSRFAGAG